MEQEKTLFGIEKAAIEEMQCRAETMRDSIIHFWLERCEDKEYGSFLTNFDSEGKDLGTPEKYLNTQCRFFLDFHGIDWEYGGVYRDGLSETSGPIL